MKEVFMVSEWDIDYLKIFGFFSSKERAEIAQRQTGGQVDVFPLDQGIKELGKGWSQWRLWVYLPDGDVSNVEDIEKNENPYFDSPMPQVDIHGRNSKRPYLCVLLWARDAAHARKIAETSRVEWIREATKK